jgi:hypothetical protein
MATLGFAVNFRLFYAAFSGAPSLRDGRCCLSHLAFCHCAAMYIFFSLSVQFFNPFVIVEKSSTEYFNREVAGLAAIACFGCVIAHTLYSMPTYSTELSTCIDKWDGISLGNKLLIYPEMNAFSIFIPHLVCIG